ncbi:MAG TPA: PAS domain-containing protein [Candidatus Deferrimicrobiaceae bacterium]|nr:PAS domain-containing protein [Candidatus Deferrimicrobiaceae bacterium]
MASDAYIQQRNDGRRYEAVLRLSEALSVCTEPEELTKILSEQLREFLDFLRFYIVVYKEKSSEVEWAVVGREKSLMAVYADVPVEQRPSWQAYATQEPFHIRDWDADEKVPARLKQGIVAQGLDQGPLVFVPLTTPQRRLGALGISGSAGTVYTTDDVSFLRLIGRVVAFAIDDNFNLRELQRQNERLQRSERELREVIETIPSMAWSTAEDGTAEFFNGRWLAYAGLTADQAKGWGWTVAVHPDDLKVLMDYWRTIMASGQSGEIEARLRRFDGVYRWFLFRATPSLDDNARVVKWYGTNTDIEQRKRAEGALRRSEAYLAEAQRVTHTGSCAVDGASRGILYWSEEMFRLYGFEPQHGLPTWDQWMQRIHPEDHEKFRTAGDKTFLQKVHCDVEFRIVRPDGTVRNIHAIGHPVLNANGELVQVVGTMVDITEPKRTEESLRRSESYLAQAQRLAHIGSWAWDIPRREALYISDEWYRIYGFDPKDGMPGWEQRLQLVHPEDRVRFQATIDRAIAEKSDYDVEFRILRPHSPGRYIHSVGHPVLGSSRELLQFVGVSMDVTERKQAEEEHERLRQELADLAHLNRVSTMGELTASLAHEIKQPIGAAVTNADACVRLLDRDQPDIPEAREAALEMARDARRAADIIDRVRSLYQKGSSQLDTVDINEVIGEMVIMLQNEAKRHSVTIRTDLAKELPLVMADRVQLQQVLLNLMLNGIEAIREASGELSIKSQLAHDAQLLISVSDTGVGLPTEDAGQIFDPFFTTKDKGTGLGLAITRSIVASHGGRIWATANSGRGSTFHFTLPRAVAVAA